MVASPSVFRRSIGCGGFPRGPAFGFYWGSLGPIHGQDTAKTHKTVNERFPYLSRARDRQPSSSLHGVRYFRGTTVPVTLVNVITAMYRVSSSVNDKRRLGG